MHGAFNGLFSGTTWVSRYQKGKTNLDFTEARDSESQWHQLGHMQVCTSLQADNHRQYPTTLFLQAGCPSYRPTNSVKALKAQYAPSNCFIKRFRTAVSVLVGPCCPALLNCVAVGVHAVVLLGK